MRKNMNLLTTKRDPSTSLRLCKAIAEESDEREWDENKNRSKKNRKRVNPLTEVDVELVEGDMCGGDENFFNEGVDSLENSEIEKLGAVLV